MVNGAEGPGGLDGTYKGILPEIPKHKARRTTTSMSPGIEGVMNALTPFKFSVGSLPTKYVADEFLKSPLKSARIVYCTQTYR